MAESKYNLIIIGLDARLGGEFDSLNEASRQYDYAVRNNAPSVTLWCGKEVLKHFIKEQK